jgi:hypothetical protein
MLHIHTESPAHPLYNITGLDLSKTVNALDHRCGGNYPDRERETALDLLLNFYGETYGVKVPDGYHIDLDVLQVEEVHELIDKIVKEHGNGLSLLDYFVAKDYIGGKALEEHYPYIGYLLKAVSIYDLGRFALTTQMNSFSQMDYKLSRRFIRSKLKNNNIMSKPPTFTYGDRGKYWMPIEN